MFSLHPQLEADTHELGRLRLSRVLLHKNSTVPWFILVPEVEATELFELEGEERSRLAAEMDALAAHVKRAFHCDKINVAAIGNLVPQLHVHVIGRRRDDPAWPGVVWGAPIGDETYDEAALALISRRLHEDLDELA
ncbi:MAG TPA: HIT family protein [Planctomycetes bacterium]|nr:HIT family protein [Planctomycetota bacterium]